MAAPTVTARQLPPGGTYKLPDGFKTTYANAVYPAIQFFEMTVKPPGLDGGDAIQTTTMLNNKWRTYDHRHLLTLDESTITAAYDPDMYSQIILLINQTTSWTVHFPDNSSLAFYAFAQKFEFQELKEGEMPLVNITIRPTNWDPTNFVEADPVYTPASGT